MLYFGACTPEEHSRLTTTFPNLEIEVIEKPIVSAPTAPLDADIISVFVDSEVKEAMLKNFPNLKFISARSAGVDHIDTNICKERNITISNVPRYGEATVAEHAFALILALSRKLFQSYE